MPEVLLPRSTSATPAEQEAALAAPVADPAWMLARQWQTGGLVADDAGSPVRVSLAHHVVPLAVLPGNGSAPVTLEGASALEPWVEAEHPPALGALDHGRLVRLATELARRLADESVAAATAVLARAFPLAPDALGEPLRRLAGRVPDPRTLHPVLVAALGEDGDHGAMPDIPGLAPELTGGTERACRGWVGWVSTQVASPSSPSGSPVSAAALEPAAWDPQRMEYRFALSAALPEAGMALRAQEYDGNGVEWYTFDRAGDPALAGSAPVVQAAQVHPIPVTYPGMPRPRFWELEDGDVNLDAAAAIDPAHAVLVAFAHRYANDWFLVPLTVDPGVCVITELTVVDTFGVETVVPAVAQVDGGRGPWRLWQLSTDDADPAAQAAASLALPAIPRPLTGAPVEDVLLLRDELANLAWVVERTTQDADGAPVDRYRRYLRLRPAADPAYADGSKGADAPGGPDAGAGAAGRALGYRLGTAVPDYWYPLEATTDAEGRPLLTLAQVPPEAVGVPDDGVRGALLRHEEGTTIADEEVPREGAHVIRVDRLVTGGASVVVWRARTKGPGLGEGSSGLRFDVLE